MRFGVYFQTAFVCRLYIIIVILVTELKEIVMSFQTQGITVEREDTTNISHVVQVYLSPRMLLFVCIGIQNIPIVIMIKDTSVGGNTI
jgi:hypothetical protein